jgi:hypothetical protein
MKLIWNANAENPGTDRSELAMKPNESANGERQIGKLLNGFAAPIMLSNSRRLENDGFNWT